VPLKLPSSPIVVTLLASCVILFAWSRESFRFYLDDGYPPGTDLDRVELCININLLQLVGDPPRCDGLTSDGAGFRVRRHLLGSL
jgi:hypothetical protein